MTAPRRGWSFGLRDVFWLIAVIALIVGWWVDRSRLRASQEMSVGTAVMGLSELTDATQKSPFVFSLKMTNSRGVPIRAQVTLLPSDASPATQADPP